MIMLSTVVRTREYLKLRKRALWQVLNLLPLQENQRLIGCILYTRLWRSTQSSKVLLALILHQLVHILWKSEHKQNKSKKINGFLIRNIFIISNLIFSRCTYLSRRLDFETISVYFAYRPAQKKKKWEWEWALWIKNSNMVVGDLVPFYVRQFSLFASSENCLSFCTNIHYYNKTCVYTYIYLDIYIYSCVIHFF